MASGRSVGHPSEHQPTRPLTEQVGGRGSFSALAAHLRSALTCTSSARLWIYPDVCQWFESHHILPERSCTIRSNVIENRWGAAYE